MFLGFIKNIGPAEIILIFIIVIAFIIRSFIRKGKTVDNEKIFQMVAVELKEQGPREGLWLKAMTNSDGDEDRARRYYIELRVEQLKTSADK